MDRESLAVFGDSRKHVMSIYDTHLIAVHAARWLPKAEAGGGKARDDLVEILGKERLAIEPVGNVVKYFHILGKHVQDGLDVALIEGIAELLCQGLEFLPTHVCVSSDELDPRPATL